eukprot:COSAG06_NODE_3960_length_4717_cov_11.330446_1_plen_54_part_10
MRESTRESMNMATGVWWWASGVASPFRCFGGGWYGAWGAIVAAERVGRRRRVGA